MSAVSSVDCPVCGAKEQMMEDCFYKAGEVFYHCHECGYGNLFEENQGNDGETCWKWDRRSERRKLAKVVDVKPKHGLQFVGPALFYPVEAEFEGDYSVYPRAKKGKLVWKLYSADRRFPGELPSLRKAFEAGDRYIEGEQQG